MSEKKIADPMFDDLMVSLFAKLPPIGSVWPLDERMLWLSACEAALNLIYGPVDRIELRWPIVWSRQESGEPSSTVEPPAPKKPAPETMSTAAGAALLQGDVEAVKDLVPSAEQLDERARNIAAPPAPKSRERPGPKPRDVESTPRPEGIPTTFGMIRDVLEEKPGLTAREVVAEMAKRWWPGLQFKTIGPDISTAVSKGRVNRDADGVLTLTERGRNLVSTDARVANVGTFPKKAEAKIESKRSVLPTKSVRAPMPAVKPTLGPRPSQPESKPAQLGIKFEHKGRVAMLATGREYSIAGKLRAAIGQHIGVAFLASSVMGSDTENNRRIVRDVCDTMNDRLASIGLHIAHYEGFGLMMKETEGG